MRYSLDYVITDVPESKRLPILLGVHLWQFNTYLHEERSCTSTTYISFLSLLSLVAGALIGWLFAYLL